MAAIEIINLTPHAIVVHGAHGGTTVYPASGTVARAEERRVALDHDAGPMFGHGDIHRVEYGAMIGLPAPEAGKVFLVSGMVLAHCAGRHDVFAPDTGAGAVRDAQGRVVGTYGFLAAPRRG